MIDFKEMDKARKILNLPEAATLDEIKKAYRKFSLRYHPDQGTISEDDSRAEKFREITRARDVLLKYLASYRYLFTEEDFKKHLGPESKEPFQQFYMDWF